MKILLISTFLAVLVLLGVYGPLAAAGGFFVAVLIAYCKHVAAQGRKPHRGLVAVLVIAAGPLLGIGIAKHDKAERLKAEHASEAKKQQAAASERKAEALVGSARKPAASSAPIARHEILRCNTHIQFGNRSLDQTWSLSLELPERMTLRDMSSPNNSTVVYAPVTVEDGHFEAENDKGIVVSYAPTTRELTIQRRGDDLHVGRGVCN